MIPPPGPRLLAWQEWNMGRIHNLSATDEERKGTLQPSPVGWLVQATLPTKRAAVSSSQLAYSGRNALWVLHLQVEDPCDIAWILGRPRWTIRRELRQNRSSDGSFEPATAQAHEQGDGN